MVVAGWRKTACFYCVGGSLRVRSRTKNCFIIDQKTISTRQCFLRTLRQHAYLRCFVAQKLQMLIIVSAMTGSVAMDFITARYENERRHLAQLATAQSLWICEAYCTTAACEPLMLRQLRKNCHRTVCRCFHRKIYHAE